MKRFLVIVLILFLLPVSALYAQDAPAFETIPLESLGANTALSPDAQMLAVYNNPLIYNDVDAGTPPELIAIRLFNLQTGEEIGSLTGHTDWVSNADFSADGSKLVTFHRNGDIVLWDTASQSAIKTISTYAYGGGWVKFMPDGRTVIARLGQYVFGALDTDTGAITQMYGRHLPSYGVFAEEYGNFPGMLDLNFTSVAVSPDGTLIAVSTGNDEIVLFEAASGEMRTLREASEQPGRFAIRELFFSSDGSVLTYFDQMDGQVHRWNVAAGEETGAYQLAATAFTVSPDDTRIAWADRETNTVHWVESGVPDAPEYQLVLPENVRFTPMTQMTFTGDMTRLVVSGLQASEGDNGIFLIELSE